MASFQFTTARQRAHLGDFNWTDPFTMYLCQNTFGDRTATSLATVLGTAVELTVTNYGPKGGLLLTFVENVFQAQQRVPQPLEWQNLGQGDPVQQTIASAVLGLPSLDLPLAHFEASPARITNGEDVRALFQNADYLVNVN